MTDLERIDDVLGWFPIETMPKEGRILVISVKGLVREVAAPNVNNSAVGDLVKNADKYGPIRRLCKSGSSYILAVGWRPLPRAKHDGGQING